MKKSTSKKFNPKPVIKSGGYRYYRVKLKGKEFLGKTPEEAVKKAEHYLESLDKGISPQMTIGEYARRWFESKKDSISEGCSRPYAYAVAWVINDIGDVLLLDSTPKLLNDCVERFTRTKRESTNNYPSQSYVKAVVNVLKQMYSQAVLELIFDVNYATELKAKSIKPKDEGTGHRALNATEVKRVIEFEHRYRPYALFLLLCGLMPEEASALKWGDFKFIKDKSGVERCVFEVISTVELASGKPGIYREGKLKNDARRRTMIVPEPLATWIKNNQPYHKNKEFVFVQTDGKTIMSASSLTSYWHTYLRDMDVKYSGKRSKYSPNKTRKEKELSIRPFTPYDLRHTYATLLAQSGANQKQTRNLMGHADSRTTERYYEDRRRIPTYSAVKKLENNISNILKDSKSA